MSASKKGKLKIIFSKNITAEDIQQLLINISNDKKARILKKD